MIDKINLMDSNGSIKNFSITYNTIGEFYTKLSEIRRTSGYMTPVEYRKYTETYGFMSAKERKDKYGFMDNNTKKKLFGFQ